MVSGQVIGHEMGITYDIDIVSSRDVESGV